jgi:hypothetical protein
VDKLALLEAVAERWNREGLVYAVAHGVDSYPDRVGRDLDVLAAARQAARMIDAAQDVLERHGLVVFRPPRLWGDRIVAAALDPDPDLLEIHVVGAVSWGFANLTGEPEPSMRVGPFAVDPWVRFAKRILLPALAGNIAKVRTELERSPLNEAEAEAASARLPALVGTPLARAFHQAIQQQRALSIAPLVPRMRRALTRKMWLEKPATALGRVGHAFWRRVRQPFSPCGPVICIVGPAGSGKTAVQEAVCSGDPLVFTRCVAERWATPQSPARTWTQHWVTLVRILARGAVRGLITDRLRSARQQLIVYEGCALDLLVDPRRFGLRSYAGAGLCWSLLPRPDLVVLLDVSDNVLVRRRPGLTAEQVAREYTSWRAALRRTRVAVVAAADRPLHQLRDHVTALVVRAFAAKNRPAGSLGWKDESLAWRESDVKVRRRWSPFRS